MARENKKFVLAQRPKTHVVPGETFRLEKEPAPTADDLKDGQVLLETLYLSLDPAMRGWLNGASTSTCAPTHLPSLPPRFYHFYCSIGGLAGPVTS